MNIQFAVLLLACTCMGTFACLAQIISDGLASSPRLITAGIVAVIAALAWGGGFAFTGLILGVLLVLVLKRRIA